MLSSFTQKCSYDKMRSKLQKEGRAPLDNPNVIIIGSGPAGVSAALYTARAGIQTTIIGTEEGALTKAREIENYYGFPQTISGADLIENGIAQAKRLGVKILVQEVVGIQEGEGSFTVKTAEGTYSAKVVVLATGASRTKPKWQGIDVFEGMGVSYCAVCDAFFFRGKDVAVAGSGSYALHEAQALLPLVQSVTLCTDGKPLTADFPKEIKIMELPVKGLEGDPMLSAVQFKDGTSLAISGLFIAIGAAGSSELANSIGADIKAGDIVVDGCMRTNIPGLFAAGDCTGGMKQIAKAVYEGAVAGTEAVRMIREGA